MVFGGEPENSTESPYLCNSLGKDGPCSIGMDVKQLVGRHGGTDE